MKMPSAEQCACITSNAPLHDCPVQIVTSGQFVPGCVITNSHRNSSHSTPQLSCLGEGVSGQIAVLISPGPGLLPIYLLPCACKLSASYNSEQRALDEA